MLTLFFAIVALISVTGFVVAEKNYLYTKKLLLDSYKNQHSTPVKELVANFREFTQSIDGAISPEVDAALKQLEAHEMPKQLPAPIKEETKPSKGERYAMDSKTWKLFAEDFDNEYSDSRKKAVVYRWGKRYVFSLDQQCTLVKCMSGNSHKDDLREYFDKYHLS